MADGQDRSEMVRHNSCFLHPAGPPGSQVQEWVPDRPFMSGCKYHDMVRDSIYQKSSQDLERLRRHVEGGMQAQEAEQAEFRASRVQRQRDMAALWADMRETYGPQRAAPKKPVTPSPLDMAESRPPTGLIAARAISSATPSSFCTTPSSRPAGASYMRRSASEPGLIKQACVRGSVLYADGGRGRGRVGVGCANPQDVVPFKQEPGSRGLPRDFAPAKSSPMGVLVWDRNRSHTIAGIRERGWDCYE